MQSTRQRILELLRDRHVMTVEALAGELALTPVTIRHHLDILILEGLVELPEVQHRDRPGRPRHAFQLAPAAAAHFPKNYQAFAGVMLAELRESLAEDEFRRILAGVAGRMAAEAATEMLLAPDAPAEQRLSATADYLSSRGYDAGWHRRADGAYVLRMRNCPYCELSREQAEFCWVDLKLVSQLLDRAPAVEQRISAGGKSCDYALAPGE